MPVTKLRYINNISMSSAKFVQAKWEEITMEPSFPVHCAILTQGTIKREPKTQLSDSA